MQAITFLGVLLFLFISDGYSIEQNKQKQMIIQTIYLTEGIISRAPEIIKCQDHEKIYFDEKFIEKDHQHKMGGYIHLGCEQKLYLPLILSDECGIYTSVSQDFWNKPFHQICNKCKYEWEGGVFTSRCPKCKSKDISNISSK